MTNQDVIDYLDGMTNDDVISNTMAILNGFIDIRPEADRDYIKAGLAAEGVDIAPNICHRDKDDG